ncbi:MAG: histone deacetylase [Desulfobacteraceae bacterium]|jgi:acetoin utilization deacetylase AcuC-like enzyme|nr:histone deacetylase [Desulfobacteraceae bacterium]
MQPVLVIKDERYTQHLNGIFHLENPKRIKAIHAMLQDPALAGRWSEVMPRLASPQELAWVHTPGYIEQVAQTAGEPLFAFDMDTQTTEKSYETARLAAGGVFSLIDSICNEEGKRGFAFIRPPGHHAEPDKAMGFCLFNNTALGAMYLRHRWNARRVLIVDIDAHHGNGAQTAFYDRADVLYFSLHQFPCYPGTGNLGEVGRGKGEGFTVNVPLAKGHGDRDFARIIYFLLNPIAREYQPDMILVTCGFDLYRHDRLAGMDGTPAGYALITRLLLEIAEAVSGGRILFIMEGGYSIKGIQECGLRVMQELCDVQTLNRKKLEKIKRSKPSRFSVLKKVMEVQRKYWKALQ